MKTVANIVGARPQFIKAGPVSKALAKAGLEEILVHTGQHYDPLLSQGIMDDVGLRKPDLNLGVGSAGHAVQTAEILRGVESLLMDRQPDLVVTYGDTNSTIAAALAAAKLGIPTAHVEAGLRSYNRDMPEEVNRIATDHVSDWLFAPTERAVSHLDLEGLGDKTVLTGDVMVDALHSIDVSDVELPKVFETPFYLATIHRASNTEDSQRLQTILDSLQNLDHPVFLLAHPRLESHLESLDVAKDGALHVRPPLTYLEMLAALTVSAGLFTDSGGLQKEAFILRTPCVTIRTETEWPETLDGGWNVLAEPGQPLIELAGRSIEAVPGQPFGDGTAATRIVDVLLESR